MHGFIQTLPNSFLSAVLTPGLSLDSRRPHPSRTPQKRPCFFRCDWQPRLHSAGSTATPAVKTLHGLGCQVSPRHGFPVRAGMCAGISMSPTLSSSSAVPPFNRVRFHKFFTLTRQRDSFILLGGSPHFVPSTCAPLRLQA